MKIHAPTVVRAEPLNAPPNTLGIGRVVVALYVDDVLGSRPRRGL
jgi:hypothetical protein